jgi:hypothetical protein
MKKIEIGQVWTSDTGNLWRVIRPLDDSRWVLSCWALDEFAVFHQETLQLASWREGAL